MLHQGHGSANVGAAFRGRPFCYVLGIADRALTPPSRNSASSSSSPETLDNSKPATPAPKARFSGPSKSTPPKKSPKPAMQSPSSTDNPMRDTAAPSPALFFAAGTATKIGRA